MKTKMVVVALITVTAGVFSITHMKNAPPSDLRDAMASHNFDTNIPTFENDEKNVPIPKPVMSEENAVGPAEPTHVKEWTVMVFMNVKNELDLHGIDDMRNMEKTGSSSGVNVLLEIGRMKQFANKDSWTGVRRYYINRGGSRILADLGARNMGDAGELSDFVKLAKKAYPAKHYLLNIMGHGTGGLKHNPVRSDSKGISYDYETGNNIDTVQLARALLEMGKIDIFSMTSCLMQTAEVVYELNGSPVDFIAGSEQTIYSTDYSYDAILQPLSLNPFMKAETLADHVLRANLGASAYSLIDASRIKGLGIYLNAFAKSVVAADVKNEVQRARDRAISYGRTRDNKDLYSFVRLVVDEVSEENVKRAGQTLMNFIDNELVVSRTRVASHGVAVYLPAGAYNSDYNELSLCKETTWCEFVRWQAANPGK
ncbi:MAG: hypothetical protein COZ72_00020 [Elusimicrobia bacterium CG_4_8_14_3_um_filter_50_9]|nr:MAG: hypothetical protein COZ72_00020 [Elusimicrobia bacterium CG_4_8_14_3_um_filter_50_9]